MNVSLSGFAEGILADRAQPRLMHDRWPRRGQLDLDLSQADASADLHPSAPPPIIAPFSRIRCNRWAAVFVLEDVALATAAVPSPGDDCRTSMIWASASFLPLSRWDDSTATPSRRIAGRP
jgi:hypothetical protein